MSIYHDDTSIERINLKQSEMPTKPDVKINDLLLEKLRNRLEGICNARGLIKMGSISLIERSCAMIFPSNFKGDYHFQVKISYQVCNPREGMVINCQVYNINKMGIIAGIGADLTKSPVMIMIPRFQHHLDGGQFQQIEIGDNITVEVADKKFELGDNRITIMAMLNDSSQRGGGDSDVDDIDSDNEGMGHSVMDIQRQEKLYNIVDRTMTNDTDLESLVSDPQVQKMVRYLQSQYTQDGWTNLSLNERNRLIVKLQKKIEDGDSLEDHETDEEEGKDIIDDNGDGEDENDDDED